MKFEEDDYIIIKHAGKNHLARAVSQKIAILEKGIEDDDTLQSIPMDKDSLVAVLGKEPPIGKVYGITVEPYDRTIEIPSWGSLRIYRTDLKKEERKNIKKALEKVAQKLQDLKAFDFVKFLSHIELRSATGKYAGKYKKNRSKEEVSAVDIITINNIPLKDSKYIEYVLYHESAHGIWFRQVPQDIQARWLKLYAKRMVVTKVTDKKLKQLESDVSSHEGSINDYIKEAADSNDVIILKEIMSHIKKNHKLDKYDLDLLHDSGNKEMLSDLWPSATDISTPKLEPSAYALTNPKEFFAESMSFYLTGTVLPKDLTVACEKTLKGLTHHYS